MVAGFIGVAKFPGSDGAEPILRGVVGTGGWGALREGAAGVAHPNMTPDVHAVLGPGDALARTPRAPGKGDSGLTAPALYTGGGGEETAAHTGAVEFVTCAFGGACTTGACTWIQAGGGKLTAAACLAAAATRTASVPAAAAAAAAACHSSPGWPENASLSNMPNAAAHALAPPADGGTAGPVHPRGAVPAPGATELALGVSPSWKAAARDRASSLPSGALHFLGVVCDGDGPPAGV